MHSNFQNTIYNNFINNKLNSIYSAIIFCRGLFQINPFIIVITIFFLSTNSIYSQKLRLTGKVFLEGPFDEGAAQMIANLKLDSLVSNGLIPEAPTALPVPTKPLYPYNAVDAVRLFLTRPDFNRVDSVYAWVAEDGSLYDIYTGLNKTITFNNAPEGTYYVEVRHRNHLSLMYTSAIALKFTSIPNYDFTKLSNIYQSGAIMVSATQCAMIAGNAFSDKRGEVNARDLYAVSKDSDNLKEGYLQTDVDLNGVVNALDRQLTIEHNLKLYHSKVPQ